MVYASALRGFAGLEPDVNGGDMTALFQTIVREVAPPKVDEEGPFQMRVTTLDYNTYVGVIGIGRVQRGSVKPNQRVTVIDREGDSRNGKILQVLGFHGLDRSGSEPTKHAQSDHPAGNRAPSAPNPANRGAGGNTGPSSVPQSDH